MAQIDLEHTLRDLPRIGTLLKARSYRQVWRFEHDGRAYFLKYYPRAGFAWKRLVRGNPAMREFTRLQWLQKAKIPAPHARAVLVGFRIDDDLGDAVILDAIEPSVQLDRHLVDHELRGRKPENYRALVGQIIDLVLNLGRAKLGHSDLHLGNFLLSEGRLFLLDGYAVHGGGLKKRDVQMLGHSAARCGATTTDLIRGWNALGGGAMPAKSSVSNSLYRKLQASTLRDNQQFGRIRIARWEGHFFKQFKFPRPWSAVSHMQFDGRDWESEWPNLLGRIESDQLTILKGTRSGDVLEGELILAGRPVQVIVKRPRRKFLRQRIFGMLTRTRARRIWDKAWKLIVRNIPCEWPMLIIEKRTLGYVTDSIIVLEKVQGQTLAKIDLDSLGSQSREKMFWRLGRTLRRLEQLGFTHFDAKSTNWIIRDDPQAGLLPILIDADSVRHYVWTAEGIRRLLRSMKDHPQYTPADSLALCQGYAPRARIVREDAGVPREGEAPAEPFAR